MVDLPIYLDYNGTTPIDKTVSNAIIPFLTEHFGNPSSTHAYGLAASKALSKAREQVRTCINAKEAREIIFLSGGTESINYTIKGCAFSPSTKQSKKNHIITCVTEHVAVIETCEYLEKVHGFEVSYLPVDKNGRVGVDSILNAITDRTFLITVMLANNECGTIQPIQEISTKVKQLYPDMLIHTDASQAIGKIPVDVQALDVDFLTIAGHKLYAPKGIGALYKKKGTLELEKLIHGASQEMGYRAGTENMALIVGLGTACELVSDSSFEKLPSLKSSLLNGIKEKCQVDFIVNGGDQTLPNTLSISFKGIQAPDILQGLQGKIAASAGSACHSTNIGSISYVLRAMNIPLEYAAGTLRLTVGRFNTLDEMENASSFIASVVNDLSSKN